MPVRVTLLFAVTTDPGDRSQASPHSGGWSESFYIPANSFPLLDFFTLWASKRAALLAGECSIIGYRQQLVTIDGNKLLPGGSGGGSLNVPGAWPADLNAPQDSLMLNFLLAGQPQTLRHRLPGLPDSQVSNGEYQPTTAMKTAVTIYINLVTAGIFSSIVRDLSQPDARVKSVTGGVLTTLTATGNVAGTYVRFRRVKDSLNQSVEGTFLVTNVVANADGTTSYTLFDYTGQNVTVPNGTVRRDVLVNANITGGVPNRLVVRKIGRPFVAYRGRRSKRKL